APPTPISAPRGMCTWVAGGCSIPMGGITLPVGSGSPPSAFIPSTGPITPPISTIIPSVPAPSSSGVGTERLATGVAPPAYGGDGGIPTLSVPAWTSTTSTRWARAVRSPSSSPGPLATGSAQNGASWSTGRRWDIWNTTGGLAVRRTSPVNPSIRFPENPMLTRKLTHLEAHAIAHRLHQAEEIVAGVVAELAGMEDSVTPQPQAAEPKGLTEAIEALQCPETHSCSNPELFERGWEIGRGAALDIVRALLAKGE